MTMLRSRRLSVLRYCGKSETTVTTLTCTRFQDWSRANESAADSRDYRRRYICQRTGLTRRSQLFLAGLPARRS